MNRPMPRFSAPGRPLTRREREDIADARWKQGQPLPHHCHVVRDMRMWDPADEPHSLVVVAHTKEEAAHAWEGWAKDQGLEGPFELAVTFTRPAMGRQRPRDEVYGFKVDLCGLVLQDELDELEADDKRICGL